MTDLESTFVIGMGTVTDICCLRHTDQGLIFFSPIHSTCLGSIIFVSLIVHILWHAIFLTKWPWTQTLRVFVGQKVSFMRRRSVEINLSISTQGYGLISFIHQGFGLLCIHVFMDCLMLFGMLVLMLSYSHWSKLVSWREGSDLTRKGFWRGLKLRRSCKVSLNPLGLVHVMSLVNLVTPLSLRDLMLRCLAGDQILEG